MAAIAKAKVPKPVEEDDDEDEAEEGERPGLLLPSSIARSRAAKADIKKDEPISDLFGLCTSTPVV
jgi:proline-rich protein PRCC